MSRKKKHEHVNHERWLVSYADFITLLFAFFVVLFASSQSDKKKQTQVALAMKSAFNEAGIFEPHSTHPPLDNEAPTPYSAGQSSGPADPLSVLPTAPPPGDPSQQFALVKQQLESSLSSQIVARTVSVHEAQDGLVVSLQEAGFFDSGSAEVRASTLPVLAGIAQRLGNTAFTLRVEGHTDNQPIHTAQFASNWELSTARSTAIARVFLAQQHFDPARLSAAGYAQYHPVADNKTAEGRARNRRVDIIVLPPSVQTPVKPTKK